MSEFNAVTEAAKLLAKREAARRFLLPFVTTFMPTYDAGWVHKDICTRLEKFSQDVADKKSPRLMIFMPPRHGKSEIASRNFPAWHLGQYPNHEIIATSYASALALKFSRKARALVGDPEYTKIFPAAKLDPQAQSLENWLTTEGGGYMAAGVSGPITGSGAHIGIIDDPVKNDEEAQSETTRQNHKDWYTSTFYTRLAPGGGVLVVQTRWHDDDLSGWLLSEMADGGDQFEVVVYPAIAEQDERYRKKGEALHSARYPIDRLTNIRRVMLSSQPRHWHALYQQKPVADDGEYFTRDMLHFYSPADLPPLEEMKIYSAWDLAIGQNETNDWTVGFVVGIDRQNNVFVLDKRKGRWDGHGIVEELIDMYRTWHPDITGIEKGQISMAIGPFLDRRIDEEKLWEFIYEPLPPGRRDKELRARPIQGLMRQGKVHWPKNSPWMGDTLHELLRFPSGVHDDEVDGIAWIGQMMMMFDTVPVVKTTKPSWKDKLDRLMKPVGSNRGAMTA